MYKSPRVRVPCGVTTRTEPNRQESRQQARKSTTGEKVDNWRESRQQAGKSRTGDKADNRRGQYIKPQKSRIAVEPRTGGHLQPAHSTPGTSVPCILCPSADTLFQVFKLKGADRKHKQDREKLAKRPDSERDKFCRSTTAPCSPTSPSTPSTSPQPCLPLSHKKGTSRGTS